LQFVAACLPTCSKEINQQARATFAFLVVRVFALPPPPLSAFDFFDFELDFDFIDSELDSPPNPLISTLDVLPFFASPLLLLAALETREKSQSQAFIS